MPNVTKSQDKWGYALASVEDGDTEILILSEVINLKSINCNFSYNEFNVAKKVESVDHEKNCLRSWFYEKLQNMKDQDLAKMFQIVDISCETEEHTDLSKLLKTSPDVLKNTTKGSNHLSKQKAIEKRDTAIELCKNKKCRLLIVN